MPLDGVVQVGTPVRNVACENVPVTVSITPRFNFELPHHLSTMSPARLVCAGFLTRALGRVSGEYSKVEYHSKKEWR